VAYVLPQRFVERCTRLCSVSEAEMPEAEQELRVRASLSGRFALAELGEEVHRARFFLLRLARRAKALIECRRLVPLPECLERLGVVIACGAPLLLARRMRGKHRFVIFDDGGSRVAALPSCASSS